MNPTAPSSLAARLWPAGLAGVLLLTIIGNLWVMRIAGADRSFAIEPDYYRKAVAWDAHQAQLAENAALGWRVTPVVRDGVLHLHVTTADGAPLDGLDVRAAASANRVAADRRQLIATPRGAGEYAVAAPGVDRGRWRLELTLRRGTLRFEQRLVLDDGWPAS